MAMRRAAHQGDNPLPAIAWAYVSLTAQTETAKKPGPTRSLVSICLVDAATGQASSVAFTPALRRSFSVLRSANCTLVGGTETVSTADDVP